MDASKEQMGGARCAHSIQQSESVLVALAPHSAKHAAPLVSTALWRNPFTQEAFIVLTTFLMRQLQPPALGLGLASQSPPASVEYPATITEVSDASRTGVGWCVVHGGIVSPHA